MTSPTGPFPNYFSPLEFRIAIKRIPHVEFFTQRISVPGISASPILQPTRFNNVWATPDQLQYNNLEVSFIIDENMNNYMEIWNWMVGITFPENHEQFRDINESEEGLYSDIRLQIMNSKKNPNIELNFTNCFPINLSDVSLDITQQDVIYPEASVTFQYDTFRIGRL